MQGQQLFPLGRILQLQLCPVQFELCFQLDGWQELPWEWAGKGVGSRRQLWHCAERVCLLPPRQMGTLKGTAVAAKNNQAMLQAVLKQSSAQGRCLKKEKYNKFMSVLEEESQEQ